jgi:hypothetical protein
VETNDRYYFRRACEEFAAARRAVTPAARERRRDLAENFLKRVNRLDATRVKIIFELQCGAGASSASSQDHRRVA